MNNAPLYGESTMQFKPAINTTPDTGNASVTSPLVGAGSGGLAGGNHGVVVETGVNLDSIEADEEAPSRSADEESASQGVSGPVEE